MLDAHDEEVELQKLTPQEAIARAIRMHRQGLTLGLLCGFILGWASACAFDGLLLWVARW